MFMKTEWVDIPADVNPNKDKWFAIYYCPKATEKIQISDHTGSKHGEERPTLPHTNEQQLLWVQGASRLVAKNRAEHEILKGFNYSDVRKAGLTLASAKRRKRR